LLVCLFATMCCSMAAAQTRTPAATPPAGQVRVFESTEHTIGEPEERGPISFGPQRAPELTIFVNDAKRYQTIDGFGHRSQTPRPGCYATSFPNRDSKR
jgi:hypothetical protein